MKEEGEEKEEEEEEELEVKILRVLTRWIQVAEVPLEWTLF